jgi:hypothetical protein
MLSDILVFVHEGQGRDLIAAVVFDQSLGHGHPPSLPITGRARRHCHENELGSERRIGYDVGVAPLGFVSLTEYSRSDAEGRVARWLKSPTVATVFRR